MKKKFNMSGPKQLAAENRQIVKESAQNPIKLDLAHPQNGIVDFTPLNIEMDAQKPEETQRSDVEIAFSSSSERR